MPSQQQQLSPTVYEHAQLMGSAGNTESGSRTQSQTPTAASVTGSILPKVGQPGLQWTAARQRECKWELQESDAW